MSVENAVTEIAVDAAMAAIHQILDESLKPEHKAAALDVIAERASFDARGQRQLDERLAQQAKQGK
jgi:hypothetical protein